jgi:hypothetical protein
VEGSTGTFASSCTVRRPASSRSAALAARATEWRLMLRHSMQASEKVIELVTEARASLAAGISPVHRSPRTKIVACIWFQPVSTWAGRTAQLTCLSNLEKRPCRFHSDAFTGRADGPSTKDTSKPNASIRYRSGGGDLR